MQAAVTDAGPIARSKALDDSLARAHQLAVAQGHGAVALEHLLFALQDDPDGVAILETSGVQRDRLAADVSLYLGRLSDASPAERGTTAKTGTPQPGPDLLRILQLAAMAARQSQRRAIDGAIVLAAIIGDGKSPAAGMLKAQGLTFEAVIRALSQTAAPRTSELAAVPAQAALPAPLPQPSALDDDGAAHSPAARIARVPDAPSADDMLATARARVKKSEPQTLAIKSTGVVAQSQPRADQPTADASRSADAQRTLVAPSQPAAPPLAPPALQAPDVAPPVVPQHTPQAEAIVPPAAQAQPVAPPRAAQNPAPELSPAAGSPLAAPPVPAAVPDAAAARLPPALAELRRPSAGAPPPPPLAPHGAQRPPLPVQLPPTQREAPVAVPPGPGGLTQQRQQPAPAVAPQFSPPPQTRQGPPSAMMPPAALPPMPPAALPAAPPMMMQPLPQMQQHVQQPMQPQMQQQALSPSIALDVVSAAAGLPASMRLGAPMLVEVRIPRDQVDVPRRRGPHAIGRGQDTPIYRVVSVRLGTGGISGLAVEPRSPETIWIGMGRDFDAHEFVWQFVVTPTRAGRFAVTLSVSGRTVSPYGVTGDDTPQSETFAVVVKRAPGGRFKRLMVGLALVGLGAATAVVAGGPIMTFTKTMLMRLIK
jgi:neural Wiskott-Aldrich syndrome protein